MLISVLRYNTPISFDFVLSIFRIIIFAVNSTKLNLYIDNNPVAIVCYVHHFLFDIDCFHCKFIYFPFLDRFDDV